MKTSITLLCTLVISSFIFGCSYKHQVLNGMEPYPYPVIDLLLRDTSVYSSGYTVILYKDGHRERWVVYSPNKIKALEVTKELNGKSYVWFGGEWGRLRKGSYQTIIDEIEDVVLGIQENFSIIQTL